MFHKMMGAWRPTFLYNPDDSASGGAGDGSAGGTQKNGDGSGGDNKVTFSPEQQKMVDVLLGERAKRAETSAVSALLKELGVDKVDDLKATLGDFKKLKDAQKSELEKAQEAARDAQAKIDAAEKAKTDALAHAQMKLLRAAVIAEAVKQNFDEAEISSVWLALQQDKALYESIQAKADADDEFSGVDKAVETIAKAHPKWLKQDDDARRNADINARNRNNKRETDEERKAREEALRARYRIR